jgi:hypothetical protein
MKTSPTKGSSGPQRRSKAMRALTIAGVLLFFLGAALAVLLGPQLWYTVLRWTGLVFIAAAGLRGSSLTYWIFFSMLLGGEIGLDRPQLAEHLRVLSDIFLRLIKVIVAPLILGTLVTGIAGHGNLRSVGRIGLKSLIYFEVVTTLALFIGVGAINISRAGEGLTMPVTPGIAAVQNAEPMRWEDFPREYREVGCRKPNPAGCRVRTAFRNRARAAAGGQARAYAEVLRIAERGDVFVYEYSHVFRTHRRWRGGGLHRGPHGNRRVVATGEAVDYGVCGADRLPARSAAADRHAGAASTCAVSSRRRRARDDCVCDQYFRGSPSARDGGNGGVRRAPENRGVRNTRRIQL